MCDILASLVDEKWEDILPVNVECEVIYGTTEEVE